MSFSSNHWLSMAIRYISSSNANRTTAQVLLSTEEKNNYYKKIGSKALEHKENDRPEAWNDTKPFQEIPGPRPLPLVGNLWRFLPGGQYYNIQLVELHKRLRKQFGSLVYLNGIPGKRPILFAYDPDDIEQVLRNEGPWPIRYGLPSFVYYRNHVRNDVFQGVGGVLTVQGEEWFKVRSAVNKILMQPKTVALYVDSMNDVANGLVENMRYFSKNTSNNEMPEDFQNELYKWTHESIGVIAYNKRIGCLDPNLDKDSEPLKFINLSVEMFELIYKLDVLPSLWPVISTRNWRRFVQILDYLTKINKKYIDECLANSNGNINAHTSHERSVLERLASIDKKLAFAMTTDMLIAGIDTTGRTMGSALYFLAKNPEKQEKLRKELKEYLSSKESPVTKKLLSLTPYLTAVVKETTRLSPVSIGNLRTTVKDMILSGYQIPKGTDVLAVNIIPSLEEKYFSKTDQFIPERWLRTNHDDLSHKNVHPFVYLPFGFGPRSCIGKRLAFLELEVGIAKVIRNFKLSWHHPNAAFGSKLLYGIIDPLKIKVEEVHD